MDDKKLDSIKRKLFAEFNTIRTGAFDNLSDAGTFAKHAKIVAQCGDVIMAKQFREFVVDDSNKLVLRFLLYYFNNNPLAETVFPNSGYRICNNIMICGSVGVGKTMLMQVFEKYLRVTDNPNTFHNLSVTQMINYYKIHNHLDQYTYNEKASNKFEGNPVNVCLNDIGLNTHNHFGVNTKELVVDFFHARNEIWSQQSKYAHITTNLTPLEIKEYFKDGHNRLADRFKTYNVINLTGDSRR